MGRLSTSTGDQFGHKVLFSFKSAANTAPSKTLLELHYNKGFAIEHDAIEVCKQIGLISLSGSWYSYGSEEKPIRRQGIPKLIQAIKKKGEWDNLMKQCYENMGLTAP